MPILTGIIAPVGAIMALKWRLTPLVALTSALLVLFGWINQVSIWFHCEVTRSFADGPDNKGTSFCPALVANSPRWGVGTAKPWLGLAVIGLFFCYSGICTAAIVANKTRHRNKNEREMKLQGEAVFIERIV